MSLCTRPTPFSAATLARAKCRRPPVALRCPKAAQPAGPDPAPHRDAPIAPVRASRRRLLGALPPCACAACAAAAGAAAADKPRNAALDQAFAAAMAGGMADYEASIAPIKRRLLRELLSGLLGAGAASSCGSGQPAQLLELGVGTGPNLVYYADFHSSGGESEPTSSSSGGSSRSSSGGGSEAAAAATSSGSGGPQPPGPPPLHITGLDPNPFMRPYLEDNLRSSGWPQERFAWVQGSAEAMPLADACMDAVVCTLVLCSVPDVQRVLHEVARVLKPGGSFLFIEHTLAQQGKPLLRLGQCVLNPLQRALADNCHLTRDPLPLIQATPGFGSSSGDGSPVTATRFAVDGAGLIAPHIAGIARKAAAAPGSSSASSSRSLAA